MSLERCPLCGARLAGANVCRRCGADLTLAQAALSAAARQLEQALAYLAAGECERGTVCADQALRLHRTELGEVVAKWLETRSPQTSPTWQALRPTEFEQPPSTCRSLVVQAPRQTGMTPQYQ